MVVPTLYLPFSHHKTQTFGESLLQFASEADDVSEKWLAFQVATSYGLDKATMDERLEWTRSNVSLVSAVATNPIAFLGEWEGAEEPWQFLAACDEYYHCCVKLDRKTTSLPVATDATCSGLQILAGLARDKSTATLVNVVPLTNLKMRTLRLQRQH